MEKPISLIALCAILALAGCGGSGSSSVEKTKPKVTVPKGPPPKKLVIVEIEKGTGATVKTGDEVTVQWVAVQYRSHKEIGSSWSAHKPFTFKTDAGRVIPGWDRGVIGMKVGGRRELIVPPSLAYGHTGSTSVPPNEGLVFVIDLLAVR
jgi:peptidylprolyl isomerase